MSEGTTLMPETPQSPLLLTMPPPRYISICFQVSNQSGNPSRRRYWIAMWLGWIFGPLVMAFSKYKLLSVGIWQDGKWSWWEVER